MKILFAALACWWAPLATAPSPEPTPTIDAPFGDDKPLKALDAWLKLYRAGKIDFRSPQNIGKDSIAAKFGLVPKNAVGVATWAGDLDTILAAIVKLETPEATQALVEVAAIGFEPGKQPLEQAPLEVRNAGEQALAKLPTGAPRDELTKCARGEVKVEKARMLATRLAAIRGMGRLQDAAFRPTLETLLADADETIRAQAADALGELGDDAAAKALIAALEKPTETSDLAIAALGNSLRELYTGYAKTMPDAKAGDDKAKAPDAKADAKKQPAMPDSVRLAVRAAAGALGRATWRADMALVKLLDEFRSAEAIPALIGVLERFAAHPELVKSGVLSGLLLFQTHEVLVGMTGAVIPADQPAKWRAFWDTEKDKIEVQERKEKPTSGGTSAATFCGIPVQGTRVVFVLDLSGSMMWPMEEETTDKKKKQSIRLDFAKRELRAAIDALAPNAMFNLVTFNGNPKPELWNKDLVPANEKNRERFKKHVDGLRADGGTNLWSGLDEALKIKFQIQGQRYGANIDELFVLSDGAPNLGDVIDPVEIVRVVKETNRSAKVRINTIYISSAAPEEVRRMEAQMSMTPQKLMRTLAEQNGGVFKEL